MNRASHIAESLNDPAAPERGALFRALFPVVLLALVTVLAYANAWPNAAVYDDHSFLVENRIPALTDVRAIFTGDVWRLSNAGSQLYRPALLYSLALDRAMYGDWLAGYHLSNIALHLLVVLLLYGLLRHLLGSFPGRIDRPDLYALLAALVFAVHPVHTEVVASVFNRSSMLVSLGAISGIWWLLHHVGRRPLVAWSGLAITYFFALLSKESAVVIPGLAVLLILLMTSQPWPQRIRQSLPALLMLLPLAAYFYLRSRGLVDTTQVDGGGDQALLAAKSSLSSDALVSLRRILFTLGNWGTGLRLMVWPHPLRMVYPMQEVSQYALILAVQLVLLAAAFLRFRRGDNVLLAGLGWFYVALIPATKFFGLIGFGAGLADRHLYFASIGPTLLLAFALAALGHRLGPRRVPVAALLAVLVLMPLTWSRNHDWHSNVRLFESELSSGVTGTWQVGLLALSHAKQGNYTRAAEICDQHQGQIYIGTKFASACSNIYVAVGRDADANRANLAFIAQVGYPNNIPLLANYYMQRGRVKDAARMIDNAMATTSDAAQLAAFRGMKRLTLHPRDREQLIAARADFQEALRLNPRLEAAKSWGAKVDAKLQKLDAEQPRVD